MTTNHATWMQTASGKCFRPLEPTVDMIELEDIAHALANLCRYAGHTRWFYSVADHSEIASHAIVLLDASDPDLVEAWRDRANVPPIDALRLARGALLHDAAEAYLVDIPSPIKPHLTGYKEMERRVMEVIGQRFGVPIEDMEHPCVKHIDRVMLATEKRDLFGPPPQPWGGLPAPLKRSIFPRVPFAAKLAFLNRYEELFT